MGLMGLFVKKKKEAPKPFNLPKLSGSESFGLKPLQGSKQFMSEAPKKELSSIKEMAFPKLPEPRAFGKSIPAPKPLELPSVSVEKMPEPHLFVKVDKYRQVRESSKKLAEKLKDLTGTLEKLEDLKKEEEQKLGDLRGTLKNMSDAASELDKTFRSAREEYE
ncbi:MAG: hypothetical protein GON13_01680 [Nanoarchaeota archaeon]|nr:hypothetical protein [Nanoarchaeota archaeon]